MNNWLRIRKWGAPVFYLVAAVLTVLFISYSHRLTNQLAEQEQNRMELWASATSEIINPENTSLRFPLQVIENNDNIPVILTDESGNLLLYRNIDDSNRRKFQERVESLRKGSNMIEIEMPNGEKQFIFYEDSDLLKRLSRFPWIELIIIFSFFLISYLGFTAVRKAERNRVWVGLSKETAHQMGTPISSLMGWIEFLKNSELSDNVILEMEKDLARLSDVSARFSKIGSQPSLEMNSLKDCVEKAVNYMQNRIPGNIDMSFQYKRGENYSALISDSLFQWVIENLIRNAVDALSGESGKIKITLSREGRWNEITVSDSGKGVAKKRWKKIFQPGYTTKQRGWGLGLTLAKRIVEEYHEGEISVIASEPFKETTFRLRIPAA